jgi:hypothetical protein
MAGALNVIADVGQQSGTAETIISTIGALLGVVLGGFLTVMLDSIRQRRQEDRLERAARRLLSDELAEARDVFLGIAHERVVRRERMPEPIGSWDQYRELLASRMADGEWRQVANAVLTARRLRGELQPLVATEVGLGQLRTSLVTELEQTAQTLNAAVTLLGALGGPSHQEERTKGAELT